MTPVTVRVRLNRVKLQLRKLFGAKQEFSQSLGIDRQLAVI